MKKLASVLAGSLFALMAVAQKNNVFVKASLQGLPADEWVYYNSMNSGIRDSVKSNANGFSVSLHLPEGEGDLFLLHIGKLSASSNQNKLIFFYLEKGTLQIKNSDASFKNASFSGGKMAGYYNAYQKRDTVQGLNASRMAFFTAQSKGDTVLAKELRSKYIALNKQQVQLDKQWLLAHASSPAIVYPLFSSLSSEIGYDGLDSLLQKTTATARNNYVVRKIEHSIKTDKLTGIGRPALDFTQNDTLGKPVALKDFRGKYVLVDFWASWCVPCRIENPNVVAAFQQYKNKGFTVLGVSFDRPDAYAKWVKAIHDDRLSWTHVSDLKFWNNAAGKLYDIRAIPSNVLIDPNGMIVGKNLRGDELDKKLEELLGHPAMDKNVFVLKGKVANTKEDTWFYISYQGVDGKQVRDSAKLFNGTFSYIGKTASPNLAYAYFRHQGQPMPTYEQYLQFYVEPGVTSMTGSANAVKDFVYDGGKIQKEYALFQGLTKKLMAEMTPISQRYNAVNMRYAKAKAEGKTAEDELEKMKEYATMVKDSLDPFQKQISEINLAYFKQYPNSYITLNQLKFYVSRMKPDEIQAIFNQMDPEMKASAEGKLVESEIRKLISGSPGSMATNFSGTDINNKPIQLTDFKGKYVLLDFWASWCVPCRKGNPHLLQLYSKYKKKGFEIIGVSDDDRNHEAWKKAVEKDGIGVWKHVLRGLKTSPDGGFDRSEDKSESYGIHTLPTKILIDPNGKIIGRYGGGGDNDEALDKMLAEVFGAKS